MKTEIQWRGRILFQDAGQPVDTPEEIWTHNLQIRKPLL